MRKQSLVSLFCLVCALLIPGCYKSGPPTNEAGTSRDTTKGAAATSPASTTTTATNIGVPECDNFIAKYDACVSNKVPEVARAQYKASIEQWRNSWRQLANNPQTRATLAQTCKTTAEQARTSMKSYNCDF